MQLLIVEGSRRNQSAAASASSSSSKVHGPFHLASPPDKSFVSFHSFFFFPFSTYIIYIYIYTFLVQIPFCTHNSLGHRHSIYIYMWVCVSTTFVRAPAIFLVVTHIRVYRRTICVYVGVSTRIVNNFTSFSLFTQFFWHSRSNDFRRVFETITNGVPRINRFD